MQHLQITTHLATLERQHKGWPLVELTRPGCQRGKAQRKWEGKGFQTGLKSRPFFREQKQLLSRNCTQIKTAPTVYKENQIPRIQGRVGTDSSKIIMNVGIFVVANYPLLVYCGPTIKQYFETPVRSPFSSLVTNSKSSSGSLNWSRDFTCQMAIGITSGIALSARITDSLDLVPTEVQAQKEQN